VEISLGQLHFVRRSKVGTGERILGDGARTRRACRSPRAYLNGDRPGRGGMRDEATMSQQLGRAWGGKLTGLEATKAGINKDNRGPGGRQERRLPTVPAIRGEAGGERCLS
jgi:hypothetical protein